MKRITLADVAEHAGVSRATASLVLRNTGAIPEKTRERVRASMIELGYVYHRGAASLRSSRSFSVGMIVPDLTNPFTAEFAQGVEAVLEQAGIVTLMANAFDRPERQHRLVKSLAERQVDGLVLFPAIAPQDDGTEYPLPEGTPAVIAVRNLPIPGASYVGIDNVGSGQLAAEHLLSHGCRRLAFIGGHRSLPPRQERLRGILDFVETSPSSSLALDLEGPAQGDWAYQATRELITNGQLPHGIICHSDVVAFGFYRALRDLAPELINVVRVVSHDNVAESAWWEPPLTSVSANGADVGHRAAEALLTRLDGAVGEPEQVLLTPSLVVRQSCGCAVRA